MHVFQELNMREGGFQQKFDQTLLALSMIHMVRSKGL